MRERERERERRERIEDIIRDIKGDGKSGVARGRE